MPRLPPSLLHHLSRRHSPLLPILLRETRDFCYAMNELRWLREHVEKLIPNTHTGVPDPDTQRKRNQLLKSYCIRRGVWAEPLQYILGNEYFGRSGVEMLVEKGVLVPRPETADLITHFANLILAHAASVSEPLQILDLCTGTGCIPVLLHSLLYPRGPKNCLPYPPQILGIDISHQAISLARRNLKHNLDPSVESLHISAGELGGVGFMQGDIFDVSSWDQYAAYFFEEGTREDELRDDELEELEMGGMKLVVDVVISNPPYISPREYLSTTARSVRLWEPKEALVPQTATNTTTPGDEFYPHIARLAHKVQAKALLVEVGGDEGQAERVREVFAQIWGGRGKTAIWRDWGGRERGVVAWRGKKGWKWLAEDMLKD